MSLPRVSVVMPSYNHARYIGEAVESVLTQELDDLELIVVDDGSSDGSEDLLRGIDDPRLQVVTQENRGAHAALNRGLDLARGQWLATINSDDRWAPSRLRRTTAVLQGDPEAALVGSWIQVIDEAGHPLSVKQGYENLDPWPVPDPSRTFKADGDLRTALLQQNYWATTSNYVFPRTTWETHGPFRPLRYAHDWDFALGVQRERRAHLLEEPLLEYRVHSANTIRENRVAMVYEICWVLAVHLPGYLSSAGFWDRGEGRRAEQLLRSVHVYGCDKVLWAMMTHAHQGPRGSALRLLEPDDPSRSVYMDEVRQVLERETPEAAPPAPAPSSLATVARGFRDRVRARLGS